MIRPLLALTLLLAACGKDPEPAAAAGSPLMVLEKARVRPTPDPVRARLQLKLRSETLDLRAGTGAVWIADRPGRGHLAILGPLGGPVATITSDGTALAVELPRDKRVLRSDTADAVLVEATGGMLALDDLVGLLLGDLPFDEARVKSRRPLGDGTVQVVLLGPEKTRLELVLDGTEATPIRADLTDRKGRGLLIARFEPFESRDDGTLVPTQVDLDVPRMDLELSLRFKQWEVLEEVPPVFETATPEGWSTEPLAAAGLGPLGLILPPDEHP